MLKIGHRGAKGYAAENTLISFQKAIDLGANGIELDVYLCQTGEIVVIHDETIDRTTNGKGLVKELALLELMNFGIPTLEAVFQLVNKQCFVNIELKSYETSEKVVALIDYYITKKNWTYSDFIVSSFDWNALQQVRFLNDKIRIGVLTNTDMDLAIAFAKFIQAYSIHPYYHLLNIENTKKIQSNNFKIYPWTVNEKEDITLVKSLGVDGIITDFLDRI